MTRRATLVVLGAGACGRRTPPIAVDTAAVRTIAATEPAPRDSLVLTTTNGAQVWLTEGRSSHDSVGTACYERGVEIRRDSARIRVPLLYTGKAPTARGPRELEAELWLECRPIGRYRIDLATGRPTRLGPR